MDLFITPDPNDDDKDIILFINILPFLNILKIKNRWKIIEFL